MAFLAAASFSGKATPDPEHTFSHLRKKQRTGFVTHHVMVVQKDYMRRSAVLERLCYPREYDGLRGRVHAISRRREDQKRGPPHFHYNEYAERCRKRRRLVHVPMHEDDATVPHVLSPGAHPVSAVDAPLEERVHFALRPRMR